MTQHLSKNQFHNQANDETSGRKWLNLPGIVLTIIRSLLWVKFSGHESSHIWIWPDRLRYINLINHICSDKISIDNVHNCPARDICLEQYQGFSVFNLAPFLKFLAPTEVHITLGNRTELKKISAWNRVRLEESEISYCLRWDKTCVI